MAAAYEAALAAHSFPHKINRSDASITDSSDSVDSIGHCSRLGR
ncbi:hypothetical protein [Cupriavidus sp. D39]|nr:hypothetical protein [Cupriavidus sp. D39]MCY0856868.1 hypothetical protein [Cupriavidus sp. D39]